MTEYKPDEYIPTIDAILSVADLEKVSVKKIRGALQELFSIDLGQYKSDINDIILKRYHRMANEQEALSEAKKREEMIKKDAILALQLSKDESRRFTKSNAPVQARRKVKKMQKEDKIGKPRKNAFGKAVRASNELYDVIGVEKETRAQIVKLLWNYIKSHDLQDPKNRKTIICDEKLERLFKKKRVDAFGMQKDLTHHIFKDDDVSAESQTYSSPSQPPPTTSPSSSSSPPPPPPPPPPQDPVSSSSEED